MEHLHVVHGPNKFIFESFYKEQLENLPSSFDIKKYKLTDSDANISDFLVDFSSFNFFSPDRIFIVETSSKDILDLLESCMPKCSNSRIAIFYCSDLFTPKSKNKYKSKTTKKSTTKNSLKPSEILDSIKELEKVNLVEAAFISDYDDIWEFCKTRITLSGLNFKSETDLEDTIEHLISCSQLKASDKGELSCIDSNTDLDDIVYGQQFIINNINKLSTYCLDEPLVEFESIESLLFSLVNKTQTKQFMRKLFKCESPRRAAKLLEEELSPLSKDELRTFINYLRNVFEHYLKMLYKEYYVRDLVSPITKGNLKILRPEYIYEELCDLLSNYSCTSETYINTLKLCIYNNFRSK